MSNSLFPSPQKLMAQYKFPGEHCGSSENECAIRMSIAFHNNGINISESGTFRKTHVEKGVIHQPSAQALADWLSSPKRLGRAKVYEQMETGAQWQKIDFITKNGIIYFAHRNRGGDGPGHIDVIYKGKIGSGFYENRLICFWEYMDGKYISNGI